MEITPDKGFEKLITIPARRGEGQNTLGQLICKLLPLVKEREMARVLKPDKFLWAALMVLLYSQINDGRQNGSCLPSKKKIGVRKSSPSLVKSRSVNCGRNRFRDSLLAAPESVVIGQRIFRSGDKILQKSFDVCKLRSARAGP